jgi:hypothetical protein
VKQNNLKNKISLALEVASTLLLAVTTPETLFTLTTLIVSFGTVPEIQVVGTFLNHGF